MEIKFEKLSIENFKGIEALTINFGEKQTTIQGANETGKTTVADAIAYVLTGKNSLGESTFDVLPINKENVSAYVTLDLTINDGSREKPVTLMRSYQAQTNKQKEFTGEYKTVCEINGLKTGPRDFDKWIADNICKPEIFRLIHDIRYFTEYIQGNGKEKVWEGQRRLLMAICNGEDDYTYAKNENAYNDILDGLARYNSATEYLAYLKSKEKEYEKQITEHNQLIQFYQDRLNNAEQFDIDKLENEIQKLQSEIDLIEKSIEAEIESKRKDIQQKIKKEKAEFEKERTEWENQQKEIGQKRYSLYSTAKETENKIFLAESELSRLESNDGICKSCGQKLPEETINENNRKAESIREEISELKKKLETVKNELNNLPDNATNPFPYPKHLAELENGFNEIDKKDNYASKYAEMIEKRGKIEELRDNLRVAKTNDSYKNEIENIKKFLETTLDDRANINYLIDVCSNFIQEKCKKVTEQINSMFDGVTFEMFKFNKTNGEMKECCDIFFNGVPYQSLSYSTKFYVSLKIALGFQKFYKVSMPVIIDNAESIDLEKSLDVQTIELRKVEELCPKCSVGRTGRRGSDGMWSCKTCGHKFLKSLEIFAN